MQFVLAQSLSATIATGELDQGWDGTQATPNALATIEAVGLGTRVLQIARTIRGMWWYTNPEEPNPQRSLRLS